jgi:hypothetical protein
MLMTCACSMLLLGCSGDGNSGGGDDGDDPGGFGNADSGTGSGSSGTGFGNGGSSGTGSGSSGTGSGSAGSSGTGSIGDAGPGASALELCGGPCGCSDGIDNDGDGTIDGFDLECTGPADNDEGTFATGISGDNVDPKWQDCFFDGNSGGGAVATTAAATTPSA